MGASADASRCRPEVGGMVERTRPTVLLVEDEPIILMALGKALRDAGVNVIEAFDAEAAIGALLGGAHVDVVLTDVHFPSGRDGLAFAQWLKTNYPTAELLVTSGHEKCSEFERRFDSPNMFVPKPYNMAALVCRLAALARGEVQCAVSGRRA